MKHLLVFTILFILSSSVFALRVELVKSNQTCATQLTLNSCLNMTVPHDQCIWCNSTQTCLYKCKEKGKVSACGNETFYLYEGKSCEAESKELKLGILLASISMLIIITFGVVLYFVLHYLHHRNSSGYSPFQ